MKIITICTEIKMSNIRTMFSHWFTFLLKIGYIKNINCIIMTSYCNILTIWWEFDFRNTIFRYFETVLLYQFLIIFFDVTIFKTDYYGFSIRGYCDCSSFGTITEISGVFHIGLHLLLSGFVQIYSDLFNQFFGSKNIINKIKYLKKLRNTPNSKCCIVTTSNKVITFTINIRKSPNFVAGFFIGGVMPSHKIFGSCKFGRNSNFGVFCRSLPNFRAESSCN